MEAQKKKITLSKEQQRIEEIQKELLEIDKKDIAILLKKKLYAEQNRSEFFQPQDYQQQVIDLINAGKKTVVFQGAERTGKTTLFGVLIDAFANGRQAWDKQKTVLGDRPVKIRILATDWRKHVDGVITPCLEKYLQQGSYQTPTKNTTGSQDRYLFKNGSRIDIVTHGEDTRDQRGWDGDVLMIDEPCPRDKFTANMRGLVDRGGICIITMTDVGQEPWVLDELVCNPDPKIGAITEVAMRRNKYLREEDILSYEKLLTTDEAQSRIYGKWSNFTGTILQEFNKDIHILKPEEQFLIPSDWLVVPIVDIHPRKEQAIGFYTASPSGMNYVVDEIWEHIHPREIAEQIIEKKKTNRWRMKVAYIDPLSKGDSAYIHNVNPYAENSFYTIERILRKDGIRLEVACKDKNAGILNLKKWLMGPNKIPSLFFFPNCRRHIWEIMRWNYDKDTQLPSKIGFDDFMECLYRYTLTREAVYRARTDNKSIIYEGWKERLRMTR